MRTPGHRRHAESSWTQAAAREAEPSQVHKRSRETRGLGFASRDKATQTAGNAGLGHSSFIGDNRNPGLACCARSEWRYVRLGLVSESRLPMEETR
jgi:hypothetical protein